MRNLGVVRKVDHLGRIVIPKGLRKTMHLSEGQPLEFFTEDKSLILRSYQVREACVVTGEITDENFLLSTGMYISPKGAEILLEQVKHSF